MYRTFGCIFFWHSYQEFFDWKVPSQWQHFVPIHQVGQFQCEHNHCNSHNSLQLVIMPQKIERWGKLSQSSFFGFLGVSGSAAKQTKTKSRDFLSPWCSKKKANVSDKARSARFAPLCRLAGVYCLEGKQLFSCLL